MTATASARWAESAVKGTLAAATPVAADCGYNSDLLRDEPRDRSGSRTRLIIRRQPSSRNRCADSKEYAGDGEHLSFHYPKDEPGAHDDAPDVCALVLMAASGGEISEFIDA